MVAVQSRWRLGVLVLTLLMATACSKSGGSTSSAVNQPSSQTTGSSSQGAGSEFDLSGTWAGEWVDTTPDNAIGGFTLTLTQVGSHLKGAIVVTGTSCLTGGKVTGTLNGDQISFGAVNGQASVDYTGAVTATTMNGTFKTSCGNAEGNWGAKKT